MSVCIYIYICIYIYEYIYVRIYVCMSVFKRLFRICKVHNNECTKIGI